MLHHIETFIRRLRRWLSRSEWLIALLGLSQSSDTAAEPGLVLIQVDGLSRGQLEKAMAGGRLPFLKSLVDNHKYCLHSLYTGMPSTTPAMTAELLYGVRCAVPAFSFFDRPMQRVFRMFEPHAADEIEKRLQSKGKPLLAGGSAYAGIYTGGAAESHFCAASMGLSDFLHVKRPFRFLLLFVLNVYSLVRTLTLLAIEFILALVDCARGLIAGRDLWKEIKFVPSRVGVCILMRELAVIGAKMDVARGLPVILLDLIGYDEQSHRRGPSSRFAHWSLKGIDDAIARIWRAACRSNRRDYDVWIFSDHGNEETLSYAKENGCTVQEAVAEVVGRTMETAAGGRRDMRGVQSKRTGTYLRRQWRATGKEPIKLSAAESREDEDKPVVAAMGPMGHVYLAGPPDAGERERLGRALVSQAKIPMVLAADGPDKARVWTDEGVFTLPDDAEPVLAEDHPFLDQVTCDLIELCHHPNAGDLVISGWNRCGPCYTFPVENGAHAGPGPAETHAFALVPDDVRMTPSAPLRPMSLRNAALDHLRRGTSRVIAAPPAKTSRRTLRVMTYNVHSCVGLDGKLSPRRIARVIARYEPDVVALQEVDVGRLRTELADQAQIIAACVNMEYHFHPAMKVEEELYGDCILSRLPMKLVKAGALPSLSGRSSLEPRGALWVTLKAGDTLIQFFNTHLGLKTQEKLIQIEALLGDGWIGGGGSEPIVFCGDFNASPQSKVWRLCTDRFRDVQTEKAQRSPQSTWFGHHPLARIDHIFIGSQIEVLRVDVGDDYLSRVASDHRPLFAELRMPS